MSAQTSLPTTPDPTMFAAASRQIAAVKKIVVMTRSWALPLPLTYSEKRQPKSSENWLSSSVTRGGVQRRAKDRIGDWATVRRHSQHTLTKIQNQNGHSKNPPAALDHWSTSCGYGIETNTAA